MVSPRATAQNALMEILWRRFFSQRRYRMATRVERRIIELQISAGIAVRSRRRVEGVSQHELAARLQSSQARISKLEQAAESVSLDLYVRALLELGASDEEFARAFNPGLCRPVQQLRARAALPYFPKPR